MSAEVQPKGGAEILMARYRATRDPAMLGALFEATAPDLFRLALSLSPDAATAEDALQETFLFAMEEADRHDPARPVAPWLAGVLRLKVLEARRRNLRAPRPDRVEPPPGPGDPALEVLDSEERERLRAAMQRLPEPYRGVALLRWRYGLEPAEIADVKGVPPGTVWSWLHRAVKRLKAEMGAMPALFLAFRAERGLEGVKAALLRHAGTQAMAAEVAAGAAVGAGIAAWKAAAVFAAGVLLVGGAVVWSVRGGTAASLDAGALAPVSPTAVVPRPPAPVYATYWRPVGRVIPVDMRMPPTRTEPGDCSLTGRCVRLDSGEPVPGARVRVEGAGDTVTDAAGRFSLPALPSGTRGLLVIDAPGLAVHRVSLLAAAAGQTMDLGDVVLGPPERLQVRVATEDGKPLAGARVLAFRTANARGASDPVGAWNDALPAPSPVAEALSGADGTASMECLSPGAYQVYAVAEGFARSITAGAGTEGTAGSCGRPVILTLEPARSLEGRVLEEGEDVPIAGARIAAWPSERMPGRFDPAPVREAVADAEGRFRIDGLPAGGLTVVASRPDDTAPGAWVWTQSGPASPLVISLPGSGSVSGVAFDADSGRRVGGADLEAMVTTAAASGGQTRVRFQSGPDGNFRLDRLPWGAKVEFAPVVGGRWYSPPPAPTLPGRSPFAAPTQVPASGVQIPLQAPGEVAGIVRDASRRPVAGAEVLLTGPVARFHTVGLNEIRARGTTGADGRFVLQGAPPGDAKILAREVEGTSPPGQALRLSPWVPLGVVPGNRVAVDLVVLAGLEVSGRVLDARGRPASAQVYTFNRHIGSRQVGFIRTDAEGRFSLSGIPVECTPFLDRLKGEDLVLVASGPAGRGETPPLPAKPGVPVEGVEIRLVPAEARLASIAGSVGDPEGPAVPGATLHLDVNNGNRTVEESAMEQGLDRIRGERVAVAADGTFRIEGIDTTFHDHVTLVGAAPGWFPRRMEVAVAAGNTTEGVRVDLRPGLELTGTLLRADGSPAAGVPVQFCVVPEGSFGSTGVAPQAVTAADGSFSIRPVPDRHLCLNFGPDPSKPIQRVNGVWAKDPPVEARLPSLRSVRGRAVSVSGDPAPDVAVRFLVEGGGAGAPSPTTRTAADGTFAFPEVPDRQFRLWFGGPLAQESGDFLEKRTEAYPVGTNGVEVALERAFAIEGVVEDADGKPQSLAWLAASAEDRAAGVPRHHDSTDERGKFRITGLRAGNYRVQAARDESRAMAEGVAAGTRGLRLRLSDEGAVRGRVVDASGALVPRAQVYVTSVGPQGVSSIGVTADEQGRFGVAGDKGTDYVVEAEGGSRGKARVESVPGGTRDLEVRLGASRGGALSGRVLDAEGRPAADVLVHARRLATDMVPEEAINLFARDGAGQEPEVPLPRGEDRRDARTGADGAYDFGDMPAGRWVLWAGGPATAWRPSAAARFEGAGGPVELRVERGWTLRTRLVDAEGKPRLFVSVMVQVPGAPPGPAFRVVLQTGRGGMLELPGLPPGPVTILECNVQPAPAWTVPEQAPGAEPETLRPKE